MIEMVEVSKETTPTSKFRLRSFSFLMMLAAWLLTSQIAWSATKDPEKKHEIARCKEKEFVEFELRAKLEVLTYRLGNSFRADLVEFVNMLDKGKRQQLVFCGYSSDDYLALLYHATATMSYLREKNGPFPPDTFVALAEFTINHIWNDNFKSGWHGFPKNRKHISYIDLDPKFYSILSSL
jgi:hypothetical protein